MNILHLGSFVCSIVFLLRFSFISYSSHKVSIHFLWSSVLTGIGSIFDLALIF
ncbi:hypothetical protein V1511DRAFT_492459 [Dipodascopsis uninucleata]